MMQCGSSLRGQDSGLTDDGGVFNNIFIIHNSTSYGHFAALSLLSGVSSCHFHNFTSIKR